MSKVGVKNWNATRAKELIRASGFRNQWLAEQIGITASRFNDILRGRKPSPQTVKLLALLLSTKEDDLLRSSEEAS